jgi:membrane protein required for colicin V production
MLSKVLAAIIISMFGRHMDVLVIKTVENVDKTLAERIMQWLDTSIQDFVALFTFIGQLNLFDYTLVAIFTVSILLSITRGFIHEVLSLLTWFVALFLSIKYCSALGPLIPGISSPRAQVLAGFILIFLSSLLFGALLNKVITTLVQQSKLSILDRILGFCFGFLRGAMITLSIYLFLNLSALHEKSWWKSSQLIPIMNTVTLKIEKHIPELVRALLKIQDDDSKTVQDIKKKAQSLLQLNFSTVQASQNTAYPYAKPLN